MPDIKDPENTIIITLKGGDVVVQLLADVAPLHTARMKQLARDGAYDNVCFHRVIDGFMAQTGDVANGNMESNFNLRSAGTGGSQYPDVPAEFSNLPHDRGTIGAARSQNPNSANSQFFINFSDNHFLNKQYTVYGRVLSGMEYVDAIVRGEPPASPDRMIKVRVAADVARNLLGAAALVMLANAAWAEGDGPGPNLVILIDGVAKGEIIIDLSPDLAPKAVAQIVALAQAGAYDNVVFHRVIEGFMAQTGDVKYGKKGSDTSMAGMGGSDLADLPAEFSPAVFDRGIVGMARSSDPDSANSQFFIMFAPGDFLNGQYTVVGKVISGMEIVDQIKRGDGANGEVTEPDVMAKVTVQE